MWTEDRRVPGAMSPCWHGSLDLARLTCLIWLLVCIVRDVPCISDPTYELIIGQVVRTSLPLEETSRRGSCVIAVINYALVCILTIQRLGDTRVLFELHHW